MTEAKMKNIALSALVAVVCILAFAIQDACHATEILGIGGKCLDVSGGGTANGTSVDIWPCRARSPNQRWTLTGEKIIGIGGKCLDVDGGRSANGTRVQMWDCKAGSPNQSWRVSNGQIIGIGGKCLDVAGGDTDNGTLALLWECHGGPNQQWSLLPSIIER